jgi:PadR family transcriptional regulator, regulatory protein PadR
MNYKGGLPLLILHLLSEQPRHGYDISRRIREASKSILDYKDGALYPTLDRLEEQGFIRSNEYVIENGRTRKYVAITEEGRTQLQRELQEWNDFQQGMNLVLSTFCTEDHTK